MKLENLLRTAEQAAQDLKRATQAVEEVREEISKPAKDDRSPLRWRRLAVFSAICLLAAVVAACFAIPAFVGPSANIAQLGGAVVLVGSSGDPSSDIEQPVLITTYVDQSSTDAKYEFSFPQALAGRPFAVLLRGTAVLEDADSDQDISADIVACGAEMREAKNSTEEKCQVLRGYVPEQNVAATSLCSSTEQTGSILTVSGRASLTSTYNWAHYVTSMPYLRGEPDKVGLTVTEWSGTDLSPGLNVTAQTGCQLLTLNPSWQDFESNPTPTFVEHDLMAWDSSVTNAQISVVSTDRGALWKGTLLIAAAGASAGLGFGFMPVAYDARRAWRRSNATHDGEQPTA